MKNKLFLRNLSWIFFGNVLHAILAMILNIAVGNLLSKEEYGIINYANSFIVLFNSFSILGVNDVITKFFDDDNESNGEYIKSAIFLRTVSSIITICFIFIIITFVEKFNFSIISIFVLQSLMLLFSVGDVFVYWFRYKNKANIVAIARLVSFFIASVIKIISIVVFKNIYLYSLSLCIESLFLFIILFFYYKKDFKRSKVSFKKIKKILNKSYPFVLSSFMVSIYAQTDKFMLENMLGSEQVADYSVAVTIAGIISVAATAIIDGFRAELFSSYSKDKNKYIKRVRQLYCFIFWLCLLYGCFITLFSKQILSILYGSKYLDASSILSVIVWYTSFSYFGAINNIYMVCDEKQKYVQVNTFVGASLNIILNLLFINLWGTIGAALASLLTQFVTNFIILIIIKDLRPLFKHILCGIIFKF